MSTTIFSEAPRPVTDKASMQFNEEEQQATILATRMEALSSPVRLRALRILMGGIENTISVTGLTEMLGMSSQGGVSVHIQRLVRAGFLECVEGRREGIGGARHFYRVERCAIRQALNDLLDYTRITMQEAATG